jgi:AbrB family looped-hinge helix DNA binding protein
MKITSKGQVTIPEEVRERHGFLPGTEIDFVEDGNTVRIVKASAPTGRGRALVSRMRGRARTHLTTDQILALTRSDQDAA